MTEANTERVHGGDVTQARPNPLAGPGRAGTMDAKQPCLGKWAASETKALTEMIATRIRAAVTGR